VKAIWHEINANEDVRLRGNKDDVNERYEAVINNPLSFPRQSSAPLLPKEIMLYLLDVMNFIHGVNCFYGKVASYQPLTQNDKEVGENLSVLLEQAQQNMANLKKWNETFPVVDDPIKSTDWPVGAPTREAV